MLNIVCNTFQQRLLLCAGRKCPSRPCRARCGPSTALMSKLVWRSGVVVTTLALINEVNLRRTRLVLRWVTVSGSIPGAGHLFQYVTNQPPKANSAFHPSGVGK